MTDITLCTVSLNAYHACALMWGSYLRHHPKAPLYAWDNKSEDGAAEYFKKHATLFMTGDRVEHGVALDVLCKRVETKYTLVVDTDVEFVDDLYAGWEFDDRYYCYGSLRRGYYVNERKEVFQNGVHPCCAIYKTETLQKLLEHFSFSVYINTNVKKLYDTAAMLSFVAEAAGLKLHTPPDWENRFIHYGAITNSIWGRLSAKTDLRTTKLQTYETIKDRLKIIEAKMI